MTDTEFRQEVLKRFDNLASQIRELAIAVGSVDRRGD